MINYKPHLCTAYTCIFFIPFLPRTRVFPESGRDKKVTGGPEHITLENEDEQ